MATTEEVSELLLSAFDSSLAVAAKMRTASRKATQQSRLIIQLRQLQDFHISVEVTASQEPANAAKRV